MGLGELELGEMGGHHPSHSHEVIPIPEIYSL